MKTTATILLLILSALHFTYGQPDSSAFHSSLEHQSFNSLDPIQLFFAADSASTIAKYNKYEAELSDLVETLRRKHDKLSHKRLLQKMFYSVHRKKLDWYENYVNFNQLFESGKYDCVTGTALYAAILERLGFNYIIYEFDYHVLLVATFGTDSVLLEATDPLNGFVHDGKEIARRIAFYDRGTELETSFTPLGSQSTKSSYHVNNKITLLELAGLQYFNLSVKAFNDGQLNEADQLIKKADFLYPSNRIKEIKKIFARSANPDE